MGMDFNSFKKEKFFIIEKTLDGLLPDIHVEPELLHEAMRYSVFAGGKRLRVLLSLATGEIFDVPDEILLPPSCAIELIHTYSLIHDDLPAMDNDDFRRGKPSSHKKFGEAMAILAGDALLTYSFYLLSKYPEGSEFLGKKMRIIEEVSSAAGTPYGMVAGQVLDILNTEGDRENIDERALYPVLESIHKRKTGALISASVKIGYILGGATPEEEKLLDIYSQNIGLAFQIVDDVLDEVSTGKKMGKKVHKDREEGKLTYPLLFGIEKSMGMAKDAILKARESLTYFGKKADTLFSIADFIIEREF